MMPVSSATMLLYRPHLYSRTRRDRSNYLVASPFL